MTQSRTKPIAKSEFAPLFVDASTAAAKLRLRERLVTLPPRQRMGWLSNLVQWLVDHGPKPLRLTTPSILEGLPDVASGRVAAVRLTMQVAPHHAEFRELIRRADDNRDQKKFVEAEFQYWKALQIFSLHGGYRIQYGHVLKEQQKYADAFVQYCYALALGAPVHDVEEHLLFSAKAAQHDVGSTSVKQLATAWKNAERTGDDWAAPPIERDLLDFAQFFWGNAGLVNSSLAQRYLLKCTTRKALFLAFLNAPETLRHNRGFFLMMREKGPADV